MKKKVRVSLLTLVCVLCISSLTAFAEEENEDMINEETLVSYYIDQVYEYPVLPGSEEWKEFDNHVDKMNACMIPEEILCHMTTEALLETVLAYPLLGNMFIWDTTQEGYEFVLRNFNGLQELMERDDLAVVLETQLTSECAVNSDYNTYQQSFADKALQVFIINNEDISPVISMNPITENVSINAASATVYTPKGSAVTAVTGVTFDFLGITAADIAEKEEYFATAFPNAVEIISRNPAYNCHSYAWYGNGAVCGYWIDNITPYITDGSYSQVTVPLYGGEKVLYTDPSFTHSLQYIHTAIYISSSSSACKSKWGPYGVYQHGIYDCPYYESGINITYWR